MIEYKFKPVNKGKIVCYKYENKSIKKIRGQEAINELESIKDYDFQTAIPSMEKNNKTKKLSYNIKLIGNDINVYCEDIFSYNQKVNMLEKIKYILKNISLNTITKKKEELLNKKKSLIKLALASSVVATLFGAKNINNNQTNTVITNNTNIENDNKINYEENTKEIAKKENTSSSNKYIKRNDYLVEPRYLNLNNIEVKVTTNSSSTNNQKDVIINNPEITYTSFEETISNNIIHEENINYEAINTPTPAIMINETPIENEIAAPIEEPQIANAIATNSNWGGQVLTAAAGRIDGPSGGEETYYDLEMGKVVQNMRQKGFDEETYPYWIREDGCKMLGDYVMVAANLKVHPRGSLVQTSLGTGLVCDTGEFAKSNAYQLDIATNWTKHRSR